MPSEPHPNNEPPTPKPTPSEDSEERTDAEASQAERGTRTDPEGWEDVEIIEMTPPGLKKGIGIGIAFGLPDFDPEDVGLDLDGLDTDDDLDSE